MRRDRITKLAAAVAAGALVTLGAAACGSDKPSTGTGDKATQGASLKVGLAYDIGGRGDKSFNDAAAAGIDKSKGEIKGMEVKELTAKANETDSERAERLKLLASSGHNPVIAVGFLYSPAVKQVAPQFPNVKFGIIDGQPADVSGANVANLVFAEEQGSFLVGAAAALKAPSGSVGFIGGCTIPLIEKFEAGFVAGAKAAKPDVKIQSKYLSSPQQSCKGFNDPASGKETAKGMYDAGADVVYHAAGGSGTGVFQSAKAANKKAIGVDSDQYNTADAAVKDVIITSMLKKVDVAVSDFVKAHSTGQFTAGPTVFDLKKDGVGYSTSGGFVDDIKPKLDDYKQQIVDGKITVPTKKS